MPPQDQTALIHGDHQLGQEPQDSYLNGSTDAGFGHLPQYADDTYLEGYIAALKRLPTDDSGKIQHYSRYQHFAYGYVDSPDPCHYEEH
jgi:hypothetical protein